MEASQLLRFKFPEGSGHASEGVLLAFVRLSFDGEVYEAVLSVLLHLLVTLQQLFDPSLQHTWTHDC